MVLKRCVTLALGSTWQSRANQRTLFPRSIWARLGQMGSWSAFSAQSAKREAHSAKEMQRRNRLNYGRNFAQIWGRLIRSWSARPEIGYRSMGVSMCRVFRTEQQQEWLEV